MPHSLKFDELVYYAAAVDLMGSAIETDPLNEIGVSLVFWVIMCAAAWAAAHRAQHWAIIIVLTLTLLAGTMFTLSWAISAFTPTPLTTVSKVSGIISLALLAAALYFSFTRLQKPE